MSEGTPIAQAIAKLASERERCADTASRNFSASGRDFSDGGVRWLLRVQAREVVTVEVQALRDLAAKACVDYEAKYWDGGCPEFYKPIQSTLWCRPCGARLILKEDHR